MNVMVFQLTADHPYATDPQKQMDSLYERLRQRVPVGTEIVILPPGLNYVGAESFPDAQKSKEECRETRGLPSFTPTHQK